MEAVPDQIEDDGDLIQGHAYEVVKDMPIGEVDWLQEERKKLGQITDPITKCTKLCLKHKIWELEKEGVQCTYDLMGDLDPHSTSKESTKQDPMDKVKVNSPFKIKIKDIQIEKAQEEKK